MPQSKEEYLRKKRDYYHRNPEHIKELLATHKTQRRIYMAKRYQELKRKVLGHYSNNAYKCIRCGFGDFRALEIDHIDGGGSKHRREIRGNLYYWLIKNKFPIGFQVLCSNCQSIKRHENNEYRRKENE